MTSSDDPTTRAETLARRAARRPLSAKEALAAARAAEAAPTPAAPTSPDAATDLADKRARAEQETRRALARAAAARARARAQPAETDPELTTDTHAIPPEARQQASRRTRPASQATSPGELLTRRMPSMQVERIVTIERRDAFRGVWTAHRSRGMAEGDPSLLATADMLLDAARRLPSRAFHAALAKDDQGASWAVFLDTAGGNMLAALAPADIFLAGVR